MGIRSLFVIVLCLGLTPGCKNSTATSDTSNTVNSDASTPDTAGTQDSTTVTTSDTKFTGTQPTFPQGTISSGETLNTPIAIIGANATLSLTKCPQGKFVSANRAKLQGNWRVYLGGNEKPIIAGKVVAPDENNCYKTNPSDTEWPYLLCRLTYHVDREYFEERYAFKHEKTGTYYTSVIKGYFACTDKTTDTVGPRVLFVVTEANADALILGNDTGDNSQFNIELLEKSETDPLFAKDMFWYLYTTWDKTGDYSSYVMRKCTDWTCDTVVE